ncbi:site-specific recombinase [Clostridium luticellarii]|uniref:Site-specific recombinase n=1 Tax=Clostridium luticellarii TaxID=1691940 RepID=A0A2T0BEB3_9CLOT|nr:site-specific recombinase [Clostridium luticellarii]PRR82204.1 hypothetical protein CLLU_29240 [Clostridium luticellarii]
MLGQKDDFLEVLSNNIETVINEQDTTAVAEIEKKLEELQKQLLIRANSKEGYNDIAEEIYRLREEKHNALIESAEREGLKQRIRQMTEFLNEQLLEIETYDEHLVRRLIEKITVHDERFEVEFKSGMSMEVER